VRLPYPEIKDIISSLPAMADGESVHIHHCKKGKDNDRMYVTLKVHTYLIYCHHCGSSGSYTLPFARTREAKKGGSRSSGVVKRHSRSPNRDASGDWTEWSVDALAWLGRGGISPEESSRYGFRYSRADERVWLPLYNTGVICGWLGRGSEPKYLLSKSSEVLFHIDRGGDECIIVEDVLSAIRIGREYSVLALLGTSLSDWTLTQVVYKYKKWGVWLDDDKPEVKLKQVKLRNKLAVYGKVRMIKTIKDPKEYTDAEIAEVIDA
jgi:hypothetical protein